MGLLLLGLAPCAPLLPGMVDTARGDVNYAASFMRRASTAAFLQPYVKKLTAVDTLLMLLLVAVIYAKGFATAVGSWAIGAQVASFTAAIVASYALAFGVPPQRKSVISLGLSPADGSVRNEGNARSARAFRPPVRAS